MTKVTPVIHNFIRFQGEKILYTDPYLAEKEYNDADIILITHSHFDHFSVEDIRKVQKEDTILIAPESDREIITEQSGFSADKLYFMKAGEMLGFWAGEVVIEAVPAYNPGKKFHPKENGWLGYVITMEGKRYYVAGDTDETPELLSVKADVAYLPVGGTYTFTVEEAAETAAKMNVFTVVPTHYGCCAGEKTDGCRFNLLYVEKRLPQLKAYFESLGLPESVYEETITDVDAKRRECRTVYGVDGIMHIQNWYGKFLAGKIRRYGRLEFELLTHDEVLQKSPEMAERMEGIPYMLNVHIPSNGGPFTAEERLNSYKRAYRDYVVREGLFPDGIMKTVCSSWLLFSGNRAMLPESSEIIGFMNEFMPLGETPKETFTDAWRLFGASALKPVEEWDEKTSLQRAYKAWILSGKQTGMGRGLALFDGEKRITL